VYAYLLKKSGKAPVATGTPKKTPWVWCWEHYEKAPKGNQQALYSMISDHLAVADRAFLQSKEAEQRRKGLGMAFEATRCALARLGDKELAQQLCEAYLVPHLDDADSVPWNYLAKQNILEGIADVYAEAKNAKKLTETFQQLIASAPNQNTADAARLRLAQLLAREGKNDAAIQLLKEIDGKEGIGTGKALLAELEKKVKGK